MGIRCCFKGLTFLLLTHSQRLKRLRCIRFRHHARICNMYFGMLAKLILQFRHRSSPEHHLLQLKLQGRRQPSLQAEHDIQVRINNQTHEIFLYID